MLLNPINIAVLNVNYTLHALKMFKKFKILHVYKESIFLFSYTSLSFKYIYMCEYNIRCLLGDIIIEKLVSEQDPQVF